MALTRPRFGQLNTSIVAEADPITVLHAGATSANVDVGFLMNRANGLVSNVALYWNESGNTFVTAFTGNSGGTDTNIAVTSYANVTTGHLLPGANITYDIGTPTQRFRSLYLSGNTIDLGGAVIKSDPVTGAIALIPTPTTANPNPSGIVISTSGTVSTIQTIAGVVTSANIGNVANTAVVSSTSTFANANVTGNLTVGGNLTVAGTVTFLNTVVETSTELVQGIEIVAGNLVANAGTTSTNTTTGALVVAGGAGVSGNIYAGALYDSGTRVVSTSTGAGNLSISGTGIALTTTGPGAVTVGGATSVPVITTDAYGRVVGLTTATISSTNLPGLVSFGTAGATTTAQGNLTVTGNLTVNGNITTTGNVTNINITGNSGQFFGNAAGFNALYAGISTGYFVEPQMIMQFSSNFNGYAGVNHQNINAGSLASVDIFMTPNNGSANDTYLDLGMASSTYNYPGYSLINPNDAYLFNWGNATTGGGNLILGTGYVNDIIFAVQGINTNNEVMRITSANVVAVKGNVAVTNTIYGQGLYDTGNRVLSTTSGAGNLTISGTGVALTPSGPGAVNVGSATSIPTIVTDAYGRIVSLTANAVSTTIGLSGTTGTGSVAGGGTLTVTGTNGITATVTSSTITITDNLWSAANANLGTVTTNISAIQANLGAYQVYANANVGTLYLGNISTQANLGAYQVYANANVGTLYLGNISTQANLGAYQAYANANAASQQTAITSLATNANANIAAYLTTATINTTGNVTGANITTAGTATVGNLVVTGSASLTTFTNGNTTLRVSPGNVSVTIGGTAVFSVTPSGLIMGAPISMGGFGITGLATPTANDGAATKAYADGASITGAVPNGDLGTLSGSQTSDAFGQSITPYTVYDLSNTPNGSVTTVDYETTSSGSNYTAANPI